jgi:hypothetical protein
MMADLRYVVLRHEGIAEAHYDLMFEKPDGSGLMTWRSPHWPIEGAIDVIRLRDHRRAYLDYEGPVTADRGFVYQAAAGTYVSTATSDGIEMTVFPAGTRVRFIQTDQEHWRVEPTSA